MLCNVGIVISLQSMVGVFAIFNNVLTIIEHGRLYLDYMCIVYTCS